MTKLCDAHRVYLGSVGPLARIYAGDHHQVWPCFDCSVIDPEFALSMYGDAIMYVPKVCVGLAIGAGFRKSDAVSGTPLIDGPAYNYMYSLSGTYGFMPVTDPDLYGEVLIEAGLTALSSIVGIESSSVSFYVELSEEISVDDEGLFVKVEDMEIDLNASAFGGTQIVARVTATSGVVELAATTDLPLDTEVRVIVAYDKDEKLTIYYDSDVVGEVTI